MNLPSPNTKPRLSHPLSQVLVQKVNVEAMVKTRRGRRLDPVTDKARGRAGVRARAEERREG